MFLITRHSAKTWRDPVTRATWSFADLIHWLQADAAELCRNSVGEVEIRVVGLDPTGPLAI